MTDRGSYVNAEIMRRLAGENGDCQTCDDENMTGCLIDYLSENQRKGDAYKIDQSYCYSYSQKEKQCPEKNYSTWKTQIYNLIEEDNYLILSCLITHHCCSAFDYKYEEAEEEEEEIN